MVRAVPVLLLVACAPKESTSATSGSTSSDTQSTTSSPTDTQTTSPTTDTATTSTTTSGTTDTATGTTSTCAAVNPGNDWAWHGECPGMLTPCELAVSGCTLTISYGSMSMGMPTGGVVTGTDVQFGGGSVTGCVGTVLDADTIEGTCSGGCTYTLSR